MIGSHFRLSLCAIAAATGFAFGAPAAAQEAAFPTGPITVTVSQTAGGGVDVSMRRYAEIAGEILGERIVVENRPGAGGAIAISHVQQAKPDGYSLLLAFGGFATLPAMQNVSYDPVKDFRPVTLLYYFPSFLTVPASLGVDSLPKLIELAKSKPDGLIYGTQGVGSTGHVLGSMLKDAADLPIEPVHYKGGAPMNLDLLQGRLDLGFSTYNFMSQYVEEGKMVFLAAASPERSSRLPDVPTLPELGFANVHMDTWFGLVAPAGTPDDVIAKLNAAFAKAAQDPRLIDPLAKQGIEVRATTPEAFGERIAGDVQRFGPILKALGAPAN